MTTKLSPKQQKTLIRIIAAFAIFVCVIFLQQTNIVSETAILLVLYLVPYAVIGYDVLIRAGKNIFHGKIFDENFLMTIATIGAFALGEYPEAVAVMLFYQVGELFQSYAVSKSRKSIATLMDIRPDHANIESEGRLIEVDPGELKTGDIIIIKPGERVPVDGVVISGSSDLNTMSLTGESLPRSVDAGDEVISGCVNMSGLLRVRVQKPYGESTVARILDMVENAAAKKARTENFITIFSRYYTPAVVGVAAALAVLPPVLLGEPFADWVGRALIFLVVSCPCALVISIPLSFYGGIGGASRNGILIKGGNYLETLAKTQTVVFDKTGTLTSGSFRVTEIKPAGEMTEEQLLRYAALAESSSTHPLAASIRAAYGKEIDRNVVANVTETAGRGVSAEVSGRVVLAGNAKLLAGEGVAVPAGVPAGTAIHVTVDGSYAGYLRFADTAKPNAKKAVSDLKKLGIKHTAMLTGDAEAAAKLTAEELGIDSYRAGLLPQEKVSGLEDIMATFGGSSTAYVGDGINDAPVLSRADVGIAMGSLGSDAAIEAADVVLMDDDPAKVATAVRISKKTFWIVRENIVFALGVKFFVLAFAAAGFATMWEAVFADVGVAVIAILNAMRTLRFSEK
ncbi:heavy metal translocating P-type ATPase [Methanorbis rubei]|uniref:Cadmium, zinc and cobalt-transporting ATPase n=1 Tax=Methanorbis rubei TaxID=3028300 RepID=A0AAE4SBE0_9EURY|nr:Cadmium, zinc and cobalt-transporting ATPase [Methanocorpusculaceae archaeon Cs1]